MQLNVIMMDHNLRSQFGVQLRMFYAQTGFFPGLNVTNKYCKIICKLPGAVI